MGQPLVISFFVRQHGLTLLDGLTPKVTLYNRELGQTQKIAASALGDKGHYEATFTPAAAGTWTWTIDAFGAFPQPMPPLHVIAVAAPIQTAPARTATGAPNVNLTPALGWLTAALGLIGAVVMIALWRRSGSRAAFALSIVAALIGMGGTAAAALPTHPGRSGQDCPCTLRRRGGRAQPGAVRARPVYGERLHRVPRARGVQHRTE